ncbi:MAG: DUF4011 domain-containing protein [Candidatus Methanoperedens sp.]|nr:DUF4011 domain-containing protein [Candidatus Methanoperedens sp.]
MEEERTEGTDVEKQLQEARQNLLDLTMRNRLLNFHPTTARTLKIVERNPGEIYDHLVLQEKRMEFSSANTNLESEDLKRHLFYIRQQAQTVLEEQGYTILYLALGLLEWTENKDSVQPRLAPLILVPVELERIRVGMSFRLSWTGEDIFTNISLQAKLLEQEISLPDFEMPENKFGIDAYFQNVIKAVSSMPEWKVLTDVYLGFFSFTKFVMYRDLDPKSWPEEKSPANHTLIRAIFDPSSMEIGTEFSEKDVDEKLKSADLYHVMDADPSQIAVIEDVKAGRNLVVEGPPGTGKSQTITNIIAELLASGKTVLFVSEKMAALEVVKSRLDQVGLGDFCLELHSRKSNKKEVLKELERTISRSSPGSISMDKDLNKLEALKSELNDYARALREPYRESGFSPFALFCIRVDAGRHFANVNRPMPRVRLPEIEECWQTELADSESTLTNLVEILPGVRPISSHPWRGCEPAKILPSDETEIERMIDECRSSLIELDAAMDALVEVCAVRKPESLKELDDAILAVKILAISKPVDRDVLLNPEWNEQSEAAAQLVQKIEKLHDQLPGIQSRFREEVLERDIGIILKEYKELSARSFISRILDKRYRDLVHEISSLYRDRPARNPEEIISDLTDLAAFIELRKEIQAYDQGHSLFGSYWQGEKSDPQLLATFSRWIVSFRQLLLNGTLTERAVDLVSAGISKEKVEDAAGKAGEAMKLFVQHRDLLADRVGANYETIFRVHAEKVPFKEFLLRLDMWKSGIAKLLRWTQFSNTRRKSLDTIAAPIIEQIDSDLLEPEDIIPCFKGNMSDDLLRASFAQRPVLANFVGDVHEWKIRSFIELDRELIIQNRQRLAYMLYQTMPHLYGGASRNSEAGILLGEFNRKRRHMPIRKLMSLAGGLIQKIKPCFMMSPLSIAQFLDPRTASFDVIVFDEASQVKPEDALGALLRGSQAAVIGDTRQLPPTSFFDHIVESDGDYDKEISAPIADIESILHLCKTGFPSKTLRWHYRSRHESLIAVSNQEFYDNRLVIYPSPINDSEQLGLKFVHLPDTIYDRGTGSINRKEAQVVAEAALEHYRKYPEKSLGIGTFNIKQQQAILEEVELQIREHPEMEEFFKTNRNEHFFVKNLETIQGDERDVIFLSIGFGLDRSGRLGLNFGPLNHEGGERRLNVLITRAREQCVVFSNFRARDLKLDGNAPFGLRALKRFLEYAESRDLYCVEVRAEDTDSPFEDSVYELLRSHGYDVHKQVGCGGYRIDLAIVSPEQKGRYILGIECDGAKYHSSPVARDRDRLRQQILKGLGWKLHRVWSTDWYRNRADTERRLLDAVEKARKSEDASGTACKSVY